MSDQPANLFREEVFQNADTHGSGRVLVPNINLLTIGVGLAIAAAISLVLLAYFGQFTPRKLVVGYLEFNPSIAKVYSERQGVALDVLVDEGESVASGNVLVRISTEDAIAEGTSSQERSLQELQEQARSMERQMLAQAQLYQSERSRLTSAMSGLNNELSALAEQLAAQELIVIDAQENHQRSIALAAQGYITAAQLTELHQSFLLATRERARVKREIARLKQAFQANRIAFEEAPFEHERKTAILENQMSEVRREMNRAESEKSHAIIAPIDGDITALQVHQGITVTPRSPLLSIVPRDAVLIGQLFVPSSAIGFVRTGQKVELRYDAFPFQQYGSDTAYVREISQTTLLPGEWPELYPVQKEPVYRVTVTLSASQFAEHRLQSGMLFRADISLESQPIWRWILGTLVA